MDEERRIRFLVAPALFVASLLIGALSDPTGAARNFIVDILKNSEWSKSLVELAAGGGVVVFAGGYVFGTITVFIARVLFCCRPRHWGRYHEFALPEESFLQVWKRLGAPGAPDRSQELFAGAAFDFGVLRKDYEFVHRWIFRRWNGFCVAANSLCALICSLVVGPWIGVPWEHTWCLSLVVFGFMLVCVMVWAWRDTMHMLGFMASLEANKTEAGRQADRGAPVTA